jgi:hypothetical protein
MPMVDLRDSGPPGSSQLAERALDSTRWRKRRRRGAETSEAHTALAVALLIAIPLALSAGLILVGILR